MHSIKAFNKTINGSYNKSEVYNNWDMYRKSVTDFILKSDLKEKNILVVGSGHLNDIDVERIIEKSGFVSFLDVDIQSTEQTLKEKKIDPAKYKLIEQDLTCLDENQSSGFIKEFKESLIRDKINEFSEVYSHPKLSYDMDCYDMVVILPIYTQILFHQLMATATAVIGKINERVSSEIMNIVANLLQNINSALLECVTDQGKVIVFSDVLEYDSEAPEYDELKILLKELEWESIHQYYESYLSTYGYTLGAYGLYDMSTHLSHLDKAYFLWEFDENRKMLVKAFSGIKASD